MKKTMITIFWILAYITSNAQDVFTESRNQSLKSSSLSTLFEDLPKFTKGASILSLSIALRTDLDKHGYNIKNKIPAFSLSYERAIGYNIGVGGRIGYNSWEVLDTKCSVYYYALSLRGSYHINLIDNLDPYVGLAISARGSTTADETTTLTKIKPGISTFIGTRYYLKERFALFGEVGADMMGWFHLGLNFKL
jgi:hypothetical protein